MSQKQCGACGCDGSHPRQRPTIPPEVRFWRYVQAGPIGECWEWQGSRDRRNYGRFSGPRSNLAHRFSYEMHVGPIPEGLLLRHKCDNPPCVNPNHLIPGTNQDNSDDRLERGRMTRGETHHSARLTEADVSFIRDHAGDIPQVDLARMYDVTPAAISLIVKRKVWKHVA